MSTPAPENRSPIVRYVEREQAGTAVYAYLTCPIPGCEGELRVLNPGESDIIVDGYGGAREADKYHCSLCDRDFWIALGRQVWACYRDELRTGLRRDGFFGESEIEEILDEVAANPRVIARTGGIDRPIEDADVLLDAWEQTKIIATPRLRERG